ncbi:MAG: VC_2705 family sodium/solute symporter [Xanthomonadales bacterium]|nr:VC_2705 family sodium/solute symporter [Xanthomonadales bacterium]
MSATGAFRRQLHKVYAWYAGGFAVFVLFVALLERLGLSDRWVGLVFLLVTVALYAGIGVMSRTSDATEYYVAGRRVPAMYNGMATAADWMSAASFLGLAGTLYLQGFGALAFVMGWTGGYCLVALLLAPYLRKFGQYTIPDFLGARYGGHAARAVGIVAAIVCSFTYLVAQILGVGVITSYLTGLEFTIGVFVGLGGVLVCSFLGGMRAVTWTQVAQFIILIVAYLLPVVWLSVKQTGVPVPQLVYGAQLAKVTALEQQLIDDPREQEVIAVFRERADRLAAKLADIPAALAGERAALEARLVELKAEHVPLAQYQAAERALAALPPDVERARASWSEALAEAQARARPLAGMPRHATPYAGDPDGDAAEREAFDVSRRNFLALVFCLMVGTAALPHILMRYYTTPSVRQARESVTWSLLFILMLYLTAPALAVLVKHEIFSQLVGLRFDALPDWIVNWSRVDPRLLSVSDVNGDGVLQLGELHLGSDIVVLATPAIGGLPYVVTGMVAAGGLAAALSTADGLLLTIANALSHDVYYRMIDPQASTARRVAISKALLLMVALGAAAMAAQRPGDILFLVGSAFSLAASAFFPALVLGIFWQRANAQGALAGMLAGLGVTAWYMTIAQPWLREAVGMSGPAERWFGIEPISAGVFGVPLGFAVIVVGSLLTRPPAPAVRSLVEELRHPAQRPLPPAVQGDPPR